MLFSDLIEIQGAGGLPVGASGRVVALISGGIDSPVAAYRMMQRGCRLIFVHFHSAPYLDKTSQEKVRTLVSILTRHQFLSRLYLVPFGEIQRQIVTRSVARPLRVILYRRMMLRIAEALARKDKAKALVTGESLAQVASQTLDNMAVIQQATLPDLAAACRHGQAGDYRSGPPYRHFRYFVDPGSRLLPAFRAQAPGDEGEN